jgi:hypothetical protein
MPKKIPMLLVREREIPEPVKLGTRLLVDEVLRALSEATEVRPWLRLGPYKGTAGRTGVSSASRRLTRQMIERLGKGKFDIKTRGPYLFVRLLGSN